MKHNGASKTLIWLIDGVFPISDLLQCKLLRRRQQSGHTHPRSRPWPPRCHRTILPSPLMRLVALRAAAATLTLDGGRPYEWGRRRYTIVAVVFSCVCVHQILSGKRPHPFINFPELHTYVWVQYENRTPLELADFHSKQRFSTQGILCRT
jgi:hypothetical protein